MEVMSLLVWLCQRISYYCLRRRQEGVRDWDYVLRTCMCCVCKYNSVYMCVSCPLVYVFVYVCNIFVCLCMRQNILVNRDKKDYQQRKSPFVGVVKDVNNPLNE